MATSNTKDCFRECMGKTVVGVLFDALPLSDRSLAAGNKTLVFDDGTALTISSKATFWTENPGDVERAIRAARAKLENTQRELRDVLDLAGARGV